MLQFEIPANFPLLKILDQFGEFGKLLATIVEMVVNGGKLANVRRVQFQERSFFDNDVSNFGVL